MTITAGAQDSVPQTPQTTNQICVGCGKKKKGQMLFKCRCGAHCCIRHRDPESHKCTINYRQEQTDLLKKLNPVVDHQKIELI